MSSPFPQQPPQAASAPAGSPIPARSVPAGRGASWWGEAWRMFTPAVGIWLVITVILIVISLVMSLIPIVGNLAGQVLYPVFAGGLMLGCRAIDRGEPLTLNHLFAGFSQRAGPLFVVGLLYPGIAIAIGATVIGIVLVLFGAAMFTALFTSADAFTSPAVLGGALMAITVASLLFLILFMPLVMAIWFAPALIVLRGREPWAAMKESFSGCLQNVVPFLLYGLIGIGLAIVATIPLALGWFVLAPLTIASIYTSYCDIFESTAVS
ncbi:MAG: BPSS1780 family membrane protein [Betaproteobacteria bacterium]